MFNIDKRILLLITFLAWGCSEEIPEESENGEFDPLRNVRIVGGNVVLDRRDFAYQVFLLIGNSTFCGGSVIDQTNILTAAHCVTNDRGNAFRPANIRAYIGNLNVDRIDDRAVVRRVRHIFVHGGYNPNTLLHDIAVLRIDPLTFGMYINNVTMAQVTPVPYTTCIVSGWGLTSYDGVPSNALRSVRVPIVPLNVCRFAYGSSILKGMMCAGYEGRDACSGDSGGPLVCNGVQVGVVSWGNECGLRDFPGVYAEVAHYFHWIRAQQQRDGSSGFISNKYLIFLSIFRVFFHKL